MRLWPFSSTAQEVNGAVPEGYAAVEDLLRRNVEDILDRKSVV